MRVDLSQLRQLEADLRLVRARALPHAVRTALNDEAFAARKLWQTEMRSKLTLRNKFTASSVRVDKARGIDLDAMRSVVGSVAPYLDASEHGATHRAKGKHGRPIPTGAASGEAVPGSKRKRPVRRPNRLGSIQLGKRGQKGSEKQRTAATLDMARRSGRKVVYLEFGSQRGLFRLSGGKRRSRLTMLWDLSHRSVKQSANPTLAPALKTVQQWAPGIYRRAIIQQFRRARLRGWS